MVDAGDAVARALMRPGRSAGDDAGAGRIAQRGGV
jgi:hypothetical protein